MRVLHVIPSIAEAHGGPSEAVRLMAESLTARNLRVTIAATDDAGPGARLDAKGRALRIAEFKERGVELILAPKRTEFYKFSPRLAAWLWRNVRRFDLLHIHALFSFSSVTAGRIAAAHGVPYILRPLGVLSRYSMTTRRPALKKFSFAMLERPVIVRAAAVQFTSETERDEALALGAPLRPVVLPLGVPTVVEADPADLLRKVGAPPGVPRILFLSRLDPKKNLEGLLRALALLSAEPPGDRSTAPFLLVAGEGDPAYVSSLKQLSDELGLADRVAWLGHVKGMEKAAVFAAADLFVLPSHSENFGIAAAEAMLAGLPALLGEGVAIAEAAAAVDAARLTSTDAGAIATELSRLLGDLEAAREIGLRARRYAAERFSVPNMAERLETLYSDVLADTEHEAVSRQPTVGRAS